MRELMLPRLHTSRRQDNMESSKAGATSPYLCMPGHSRNSSCASSISSPVTPTFSNRSHSRRPSSSSSLATSPDSPVNVTKSALDDLVEDPAEREESPLSIRHTKTVIEPLCICDSPFCEHRPGYTPRSALSSPSIPEWFHGDDRPFHDDLISVRSVKRQRSNELPDANVRSRMSRGWTSISSRWQDRRPTTSVSSPHVRSAPPSRASSARQLSVQQSLANHLMFPEIGAPVSPQFRDGCTTDSNMPDDALDVPTSGLDQGPIDLQERSTTPLLPLSGYAMGRKVEDELQSPLQSPSIAPHSIVGFVENTPLSSPVVSCLPTPPLSARPSFASIGKIYSNHGFYQSTEVDSLSEVDEVDEWAVVLGHANYQFTPEPYFPAVCDSQSCKQLLDDWEKARNDYIRQAANISENYGPASQTYKFTEAKWARTDAQWRENLEQANAGAIARGEMPVLRSGAKAQTFSEMPTLVPEMFPTVREEGIVGPMVQHAKVQRTPSKKANLLKLFTDPGSLLNGRSPFGSRH